jgi:uncharacterized LabA/DUF88 family protein
MRTNVYVDGFNLYYGAMKGRGPGYKWLDLAALCRHLLPRDDIACIRYFTARVGARPDDPGMRLRQGSYLRALATLPEVSIHLGRFAVTYPRMALYEEDLDLGNSRRLVQVNKTEEKGSDVNLASHLMLDACRGDCDLFVVITNDSDLSEPIRLVREELGLTVGLVNPHPAARRSWHLSATFFRQLRGGLVAASQFPDLVPDAHGHVIRRPEGW